MCHETVTWVRKGRRIMRGDMTSGNPARQLIKFALPMVLGNLFQQLYNIADTIIVGNFVGADALAAVGASASITFLFIAIATGAGIGSSVIVSQFFGANKLGKMKTAISTILVTMLLMGVFATGLGLFLHRMILRAMNTPIEIFEDSAIYLSIYFMGILFLFLFNTLNAIFNALGLSKIPLGFLMLASFVNIGLDLLFVIQFNMGVAGVAIATLIAQGLSAVMSFVALIYYIKKMKIKEEFSYFNFAILKSISIIAVPSIIQQSIV
jgi:putative MATE family efflux protein